MKAVIQRVTHGSVSVDDKIIGKIGHGFVILLGITHDDATEDADYLAEKIVNLRVFEDGDGKMNRSLTDVRGSMLVISQFTLFANTRKGRRPSFIDAARPEIAIPLYEYFMEKSRSLGIPVECGEFGAMMAVEIHNDGPVTIIIDSRDRLSPRRD